jgi:hypothetical protein
MHKLIKYVCDELESLEKKADNGGLSMQELQLADTLAHLKKNLLKSDEMMGEDGEYSNGMAYSDGRGSYRYMDGSYARRGRMNARRDSMGRYSRNYSMATEDLIAQLEDIKDSAPDDMSRREVSKLIDKMRQA